MKKYISLSKYPGKQGQYYYSEFFKRLNIDAVYEPQGTDNLGLSISNAVAESVSGISISMPYKKEIIRYLDSADELVTTYQTCNTVVIQEGKLHGYNCDYAGAAYIRSLINPGESVSILGAGSMGSMIYSMIPNSKLFSNKLDNWSNRHNDSDVIINCTDRGTAVSDSPLNYIPAAARLIIDLTVADCQLAQQSAIAGVKYVSGQEFYKHQFLDQFSRYFGFRPDETAYNEIRNHRI
jgi:shikimate 5-dehydrogenase